MSDRYSYRNLILWQRAQELAHDIIQITKRLPQSWATAVIARQIIGSATSVGANIAEGHGRFSPGAHRNHLSIARGSAAETDSWLDLLRREGLISATEEEMLHVRCRQLIGMLTTKSNALGNRGRDDSTSLREDRELYDTGAYDGPPEPFTEADYIRGEL